jgi:hypothetical protein
MDEATANDVIMAARAHWFEGGETVAESTDAPGSDGEQDHA